MSSTTDQANAIAIGAIEASDATDGPPGAASCLNHQAHVLFAYRLTVGSAPRSHDLRRCAAALRARLLGEPDGWEAIDRDTARKALHPDLMSVVDRILNGGDASSADDARPFVGMTPLRLRAAGLQTRFALDFNAAARSRLMAAGVADTAVRHAGVSLTDATLYTFATGLVVVAVGLRIVELGGTAQALPAALVQEGLYLLGHAQDRGASLHPVKVERRRVLEALPAGAEVVLDAAERWSARLARSDDAAGPDPGQMARRLRVAVQPGAQEATLIFDAGPPATTIGAWLDERLDLATERAGLRHLGDSRHVRSFIFCAARYGAETTEDELARLAYRTSRRFGDDYQLWPADVHAGVVRPFRNVCHAMATQGAAIAVGDTGASFVRNFIPAASTATYLPLALLSFHEYQHLLSLTQDNAVVPDVHHVEHDHERTQGLRHALSTFRLYLRFSHVSDIAHHNLVHRAWRDALDLDRMLEELSLDVREADVVLERAHREAQARRWRIAGSVFAFLAASVAMTHLLEAGLAAWSPWQQWMMLMVQPGADGDSIEPGGSYEALEAAVHHLHLTHWVALALSLVFGLVAGAVAWFKGPKLEE